MDRNQLTTALEKMLEELAAVEHQRWAHWQRYLHDKGSIQADGSLVVPAKLVAQWERLIATPYSELTDAERESDREQVRRYLPTVIAGLSKIK